MAKTSPAAPEIPWHSMPGEEVLRHLDAQPEGLTTADAHARSARVGLNQLQTEPGPGVGILVLRQILNPLIYLLLLAAAISLISENIVDALVILAVVALNTVIGVWQEWRAERALEALRKLAAPRTRVLRDGAVQDILALEVVPGDVLVLESGDRVAADARLLELIDLQLDESALTGESQPVEKVVDVLPARIAMADRVNMVWMTTAVTNGRAHAVVTAIGMQTMIGQIASEVRQTEHAETPLERQIGRLGAYLGLVAVILAGLIFILGLVRGYGWMFMLLYAVATAVSAIPEGLPAVISVVLALGVQRMAGRHAVIRRLMAVETLGSTTVICSDKTGTMTRNQMTVTRIWAGCRLFGVTGEGFAPVGEITRLGDDSQEEDNASPDLDALLLIGVLANTALLEQAEHGWIVRGDPTEGALLTAARKAGLDSEEEEYRFPRLDEIPFASKFKYMATLHRADGRVVLYAKGAPERLLGYCTHVLCDGRRQPLDDTLRRQVLAANERMAGDALRVLAGAYRELPADTDELDRTMVEQELTFAGLWGMLDPPRPEAVRAVRDAQGAGIGVKMITGDHAATATAIARQVGILAPGGETVTGEMLDDMDEDELTRRIDGIGVFARVSPFHKFRIVGALQARQNVVAMTGDGVNDAPALKRADIGIAMGITGTEVAKEAADIVLADDNFATIVTAVEEGRGIYGNLKKVVYFLITTNLGEIATLAGALLLNLGLPLTAVMILWVNLVTDGLCTAPLGVEYKHANLMQRPPRPAAAGIIDRTMLVQVLLLAVLVAAGTLGLFWYTLQSPNPRRAQTVAFTTLVAFQWFHALNARSLHSSLFSIGLFANRWLLLGIGAAVLLQLAVIYVPAGQAIFHTTALSLPDWGYILLVSVSILLAAELIKAILRARSAYNVPPT